MLSPYKHIEFDIDKSILPNLEDHVRFQVNSEGERGDELPRNAERLYRILVVGGSSAECYFLDQESSWPMRVQRIMERPENLNKLAASHVHVGNIGQSAFDTEVLDSVLQAVLPRMPKLDVIVIFTGASDVLNWLSARAPDKVGANPNINPALYFSSRPDMAFGLSARQTALAHSLKKVRNRIIVHRRQEKAGKSLARLRSMRSAATEVIDKTPNPTPMLLHLEQHLVNILALAKDAANRVIVVPQPWFQKECLRPEEEKQFWNGAVGNPHVDEVNTYYSNNVLWQLFEAAEQSIVRVADDAGVECVELRTKVPSSSATYYDHVHFTPAGAATVAEVLAESLLEMPMLDYARREASASGCFDWRAGVIGSRDSMRSLPSV